MTLLHELWQRRKLKFRYSWDKFVFYAGMKRETVRQHQAVLEQAEEALAQHEAFEGEACKASTDPLVRQGWSLKQHAHAHFHQRYAKHEERILIQVPPAKFSPAGYSLFTNLVESLNFLGVPAQVLAWDSAVDQVLEAFKPTVLISSDHATYLQRIDWEHVKAYKQRMRLRIGLAASLEEYDNTPLGPRLAWAKEHGVDFYYSFRDQDYVHARREYQPFFEAGYHIVFIPFGANVLHYFPVAGFARDLDFVIMATRKSDHVDFMRHIVARHAGFIDGPGWKHVKQFSFNRDRDRFIYARAKVGLNVHLPEQREWACEVNERTYQLAACGVPQLVDRPALLSKLFSPEALYVADNPEEYLALYQDIIQRPQEAVRRALLAQQEVFARHTTFHRAEDFLNQLAALG